MYNRLHMELQRQRVKSCWMKLGCVREMHQTCPKVICEVTAVLGFPASSDCVSWCLCRSCVSRLTISWDHFQPARDVAWCLCFGNSESHVFRDPSWYSKTGPFLPFLALRRNRNFYNISSTILSFSLCSYQLLWKTSIDAVHRSSSICSRAACSSYKFDVSIFFNDERCYRYHSSLILLERSSVVSPRAMLFVTAQRCYDPRRPGLTKSISMPQILPSPSSPGAPLPPHAFRAGPCTQPRFKTGV